MTGMDVSYILLDDYMRPVGDFCLRRQGITQGKWIPRRQDDPIQSDPNTLLTDFLYVYGGDVWEVKERTSPRGRPYINVSKQVFSTPEAVSLAFDAAEHSIASCKGDTNDLQLLKEAVTASREYVKGEICSDEFDNAMDLIVSVDQKGIMPADAVLTAKSALQVSSKYTSLQAIAPGAVLTKDRTDRWVRDAVGETLTSSARAKSSKDDPRGIGVYNEQKWQLERFMHYIHGSTPEATPSHPATPDDTPHTSPQLMGPTLR